MSAGIDSVSSPALSTPLGAANSEGRGSLSLCVCTCMYMYICIYERRLRWLNLRCTRARVREFSLVDAAAAAHEDVCVCGDALC